MQYFLSHQKIDSLLNSLHENGYICIGPKVEDGAIVFDELKEARQLPWGIQDIQEPGKYRLKQTKLKAAFAWANGPQAIKPLLFKPRESLWKVERDKNGKLTFKEIPPEVKPIALLGVRACDLAGMAIQDKTFIHDIYQDKRYQEQREHLFIIAVNCSYSGGNCFCVSTDTGPKAHSGFDLALTEISNGFVVEIGTEKGKKIIDNLKCKKAQTKLLNEADYVINHARKMQKKRMPKNNGKELRDILMNQLDHKRWDEVATRCLSCGNCTSVCPTCFCHHETDTPALDNTESMHEREWDSCFTKGHSYTHSKVVRPDTKSRYKQWLTHKLGTWWDQFDTSGCVGCGRCITWCPVGIDITEEMAAISGESNIVSSEEE